MNLIKRLLKLSESFNRSYKGNGSQRQRSRKKPEGRRFISESQQVMHSSFSFDCLKGHIKNNNLFQSCSSRPISPKIFATLALRVAKCILLQVTLRPHFFYAVSEDGRKRGMKHNYKKTHSVF